MDHEVTIILDVPRFANEQCNVMLTAFPIQVVTFLYNDDGDVIWCDSKETPGRKDLQTFVWWLSQEGRQ